SAAEHLPDGLLDVAYTISINERQELQLALVDYRVREGAAIEVQSSRATLVDWRKEADPLVRLEGLCGQYPDSLVWAEGYSQHEHPNWKRRDELIPASTLNHLYSAV